MIKREAKFGRTFNHWMRANPLNLPAFAFELKQTRTDSIHFMAVAPHQILFLQSAKSPHGMYYKIPDDSRGIKPFDGVFLRNTPGYLVFKYKDFFCLIDVDVFVKESMESDRRSLTSARAKEIAAYTIDV